MAPGFDYIAHEGGLDGPEVGRYHHDGSNGLSGPVDGEVIRLEGQMGQWRVTAGLPIGRNGVTPQGPGKLAVQRIDDHLVTPRD